MTTLYVLAFLYLSIFVFHALYWRPRRARLNARYGQPARFVPLSTAMFAIYFAAPVFTLVLLSRHFLVDFYRIPTSSMEPTYSPGERVIVNKLAFGLRTPFRQRTILAANSPIRGDIIVFRYPREPRTTYIKRVLGVPGDVVATTTDGLAFVVPSQERYSNDAIRVPAGHYYVVGDNPDKSKDSRHWGFVADRHLIGIPLFNTGA